MPKTKITCRVCKRTDHKLLFEQKPFKIFRCTGCGFGTLDPIPSQKELDQIYQGDYHDYITDEDFLADAAHKLKTIQKQLPKKGHLLDFGTGVGHFLYLCRKQRYKVSGYDISKEAVKKAKKQFRLNITHSKLSKRTFKKHSFDYITSFDVIEHLPDFKKYIEYFNYWLKPGGHLILTTPDFDAWDAIIMGKKWYGFTRIPQHVNYFDRNSINMVLDHNGFEIKFLEMYGFVRSIGYLSQQITKNKLIHQALNLTGVGKARVYLPLTDMMLIAQKMES